MIFVLVRFFVLWQLFIKREALPSEDVLYQGAQGGSIGGAGVRINLFFLLTLIEFSCVSRALSSAWLERSPDKTEVHGSSP